MEGRTLVRSLRGYRTIIIARLRRLRRLSVCDWIVLAQLVASGALIVVALRTLGWRRVSVALNSLSVTYPMRRFPGFHLLYQMDELDSLVDIASGLSRRNRCLVRSIMLFWLLRARGESAELVFGVRKREGSFEAHAWTVSERGLVGDSEAAIAEFHPMMSFGKEERL